MKTLNALYSTVLVSFALSSFSPSIAIAQNSANAQAKERLQTIKSVFAKIQKTNKGPFAENVYQTRNDRVRVAVSQGQGLPPVLVPVPKGRIFTAAYRSGDAESIAALGFYVGNLFTTNYVTLNNKYLLPAGASPKGFVLDHAAFMAAPQIAPEARAMARHMIMERFFVEKYPDSRIARGARQRGVADAEDETEYYGYFVEYLGKYATTPADYLTVFEIQRRWNLTGDSEKVSMGDLRSRVAAIYSMMAPEGTVQTSEVAQAFLPLRNSIHNYMTPSIGGQLDQFISKYKNSISSDILDRIKTLRSLVAAYYRVDQASLVKMAAPLVSKLPSNAMATLSALSEKSNTTAQLEALSYMVANTRDAFMQNRDPELLHFILRANSFIQAELAGRTMDADWIVRSRIAIDSIYASGLIDRNQWTALRGSFAASGNTPEEFKARSTDISNAIVTAHQNVSTTLNPALNDWKNIDASMEGVLDDTLRGSMLTELNQVSAYLKANLPKSTTKYSIENEGTAFGYLVYIPKGSGSDAVAKLDKTSIPVFAELPLDLGVVAAIITEQPQTPLSHVSIKSKSRGTPDMYYPNASQDPLFKDLIARKALVKVSFKDGEMAVREATLEEAQAFWGTKKSHGKVEIAADLKERKIFYTKDLRASDSLKVGAKAANYGEGQKALPGVFQDGLGIPFAYYADFIDQNKFDATRTLRQALKDLVMNPQAKTDRTFLVNGLAAIQKRMLEPDMIVDEKLVAELTTKLNAMYPGLPVRFRSSTNSEDLPNFSGAGLYDSYSYDPAKKNKTIAQALKKTWASVLNLRAYDERELFEIPHLDVYMAILVSPAFKDELANGVAVTRNIVNKDLGAGLYINTQLGEEAVTNPSPDVVPEETLIIKKGSSDRHPRLSLKYLKYSTLHKDGPILTDEEMLTLGKHLVDLHNHFKKVVDPRDRNPNFAIDAEFKLANVNGKRVIFIKQARPYIGN
jgi:Pyruvate phosphate dikinase, AMP/ATP-binding domain